MTGPVQLTRVEAQAVCDLVNSTFISETAREVYESEAFDSAMTKLDALASGDPSPSLPAEPSYRALIAALATRVSDFGVTSNAMLDALCAAYEVDAVKR